MQKMLYLNFNKFIFVLRENLSKNEFIINHYFLC